MVHNPHTFGHVIQPGYTNKYLKYNIQFCGAGFWTSGQGYNVLSCLSLKLWLVGTKILVYTKEITFIWLGQCKSLQHTIMPYCVPCSTGSKERIFLCHRLVSAYSAMQCNLQCHLLIYKVIIMQICSCVCICVLPVESTHPCVHMHVCVCVLYTQ